jgi:glycosyltransferase involved in cell wall biosynthesis
VPTVSVIMAVYNAHDTIVRAVRSVLDQSHADLELLLVDDASTDGSLDVVREHVEAAGGDDRVRYLAHEHNRRAAAARNTGVEAARGDFVAFLDSDDELLPTYLETLVGHLGEGVDIVVGNVVYVRPDGSRSERHPAAVGDFAGPHAAALGLLDKITPFTCDKLIRRTLFDGVRYPEGLINEDFLTNPVLAARARLVRVVDAPVYAYYVRAESVTWSAIPPAAELDTAEAYLRDTLLATPSRSSDLVQAVDHAVVFLTLSSAQRALVKQPSSAHDRQVVRDCRRRLRLGAIARLARVAPVTAAAALLLKTSPRTYKMLYSRHVRTAYGQES